MGPSALERAAEQGPATTAAAILAVDPVGLGGIVLRGPPSLERDRWIAHFARLLVPGAPVRRVPLHVSEDRLLGGLDLAATLSAGRPIADRGLLAEADGGVLVLAGAERLEAMKASLIASAMDRGAVQLERDGLSIAVRTGFSVVALDESCSDEESVAPCLLDRLAFVIEEGALRDFMTTGADNGAGLHAAVAKARARLAEVSISDAALQSLCATSVAFGIGSLRAPLLAVRTAQISAALRGRIEVSEDDLETAAALVLAPRATRLPAPQSEDEDQEQRADAPPDSHDGERPETDDKSEADELEDIVLAAVAAAISPELLSRLSEGRARTGKSRTSGRQGAMQASRARGRPSGTRAGKLRQGLRLNVLETLRAAAPWQVLRGRAPIRRHEAGEVSRVVVRGEDFRITRMKQPTESTTIFVVDASGSQALHRLAEAKGAVEILLSQCYVRRDRVALIAFRGDGSQILLPPTRSLARAKRALAALPGGGATPLAAGLDQATALGIAERKRGKSATLVVLTDGKANVDRSGRKGRSCGEADSAVAGKILRASGLKTLLIDTSPRRHAHAEVLAGAMGAHYLLLPHADAHTLSRAVQLTKAVS